jgi:hypothetical protein
MSLISAGSISLDSTFNKFLPWKYITRWKEVFCAYREANLGRRVGLYRVKGDLGSGNFSKVRKAIHELTQGELLLAISRHKVSSQGELSFGKPFVSSHKVSF